MTTDLRLRESVKLAQAILNSITKVQLSDDGILGPKTYEAYREATPRGRSYLDEQLSKNGLLSWRQISTLSTSKVRAPGSSSSAARAAKSTRPRLVTGLKATRPLASAHAPTHVPAVISATEADALGKKYERAFGLPEGTMRYILRRENGSGPYNPAVVGGDSNRYLGLYQFYDRESDSKGRPYAWGVARARARKVLGTDIGPLSSNWMKPEMNTIAGAAYAAHHSGVIRKLGKQPTPELLYAAHQQGGGWLSANLQGQRVAVRGNQSAQTRNELSQLVAG